MLHHALFFMYAMTQHKKQEEVEVNPLPVEEEVEEDYHSKMFREHYENLFKD